MLSCGCDYDRDFEAGDWMYGDGEIFTPLNTTRAKRCCSCNELIRVGKVCNIYKRYRYPYSDVESLIEHGRDLEEAFCDEPTIKIANHYHCEWCAEMYLNLTDLGYDCLSPNENMKSALKEYHELQKET